MGQRYLSEERGEGLEQNRAEGDGGTVGASGARAAAGEAQASGKGAWSLGNIYDRIMSGNGFMSSIAHTEPKKQGKLVPVLGEIENLNFRPRGRCPITTYIMLSNSIMIVGVNYSASADEIRMENDDD